MVEVPGSQEKLRIILEGLSGQIEIAKLCAKYRGMVSLKK